MAENIFIEATTQILKKYICLEKGARVVENELKETYVTLSIQHALLIFLVPMLFLSPIILLPQVT